MSNDIIQRAEQALEGITEGPYYVRIIDSSDGDYRAYVCRKYLGAEDVVASLLGDDTTPAKADAELFAAAPELIRALIEEHNRLRAALCVAWDHLPAVVEQHANETDRTALLYAFPHELEAQLERAGFDMTQFCRKEDVL